jgi:hypothetical protein
VARIQWAAARPINVECKDPLKIPGINPRAAMINPVVATMTAELRTADLDAGLLCWVLSKRALLLDVEPLFRDCANVHKRFSRAR